MTSQPSQPKYYLMKRGLYYRPNAAGYTAKIEEAGLFDESYAKADVSATAGEKDESERVKMVLASQPSAGAERTAAIEILNELATSRCLAVQFDERHIAETEKIIARHYAADLTALRSENARLSEENAHYQHYVGGNMFRSDYQTVDGIRSDLSAARARVGELEGQKDGAYLERNKVVAALAKCFPSGVARTAIEGWSEDWHGCVYIDLPTGQASWHFHDSQAYLFAGLPPYAKGWDGHTTDQKYERLSALAVGDKAEGGK